MKKDYLMRSLMFVPAHDMKLMEKSVETDADILLLDIEDSAHSAEKKQIARDNIQRCVSSRLFKDKVLFPRVNDRESGHMLKDVCQLTIDGIEGFMCPKIKGADDILFFSKLLEALEYEKGYPLNTFKIIALIETASAVMNIKDICRSCPDRLVAVTFGCEDFLVDMDGKRGRIDSIFMARGIVAMGARACKVKPIDTVHVNVHDFEDLKKNLIQSREFGYEGMLVLSPVELPLVHQYYSPSRADLEWADEIISLSEDINRYGQGVAMKNEKFIGPPMMKMAQKILNKQHLISNGEK